MFLGWYLEKVIPSQYGSHRPWYFLVQPSYWSKSVRDREAAEKRAESTKNQVQRYKQRTGTLYPHVLVGIRASPVCV